MDVSNLISLANGILTMLFVTKLTGRNDLKVFLCGLVLGVYVITFSFIYSEFGDIKLW